MSVSEFYSSHLFFDSIKNRKLPVLPPQMTGKYLFVFVLRAMKGSTVLIFCLQHFNICNTLHHFISHICLYKVCVYILFCIICLSNVHRCICIFNRGSWPKGHLTCGFKNTNKLSAYCIYIINRYGRYFAINDQL